MSENANTMVNWYRFASGNEFAKSNPQGILPYLRAVDQIKTEGQKHRWRGATFSAHLCDETRFLPQASMVSALLIVDHMSGTEEEIYRLLVRLIHAVDKYNAALVFIPISRSKTRPDKHLTKIAGELFTEQLKRESIETQLNSSVPFFFHRSENLPQFHEFDSVVEVSDEKK